MFPLQLLTVDFSLTLLMEWSPSPPPPLGVRPPTPATLGTLSLEQRQGLVKLMETGVQQSPLVRVSGGGIVDMTSHTVSRVVAKEWKSGAPLLFNYA